MQGRDQTNPSVLQSQVILRPSSFGIVGEVIVEAELQEGQSTQPNSAPNTVSIVVNIYQFLLAEAKMLGSLVFQIGFAYEAHITCMTVKVLYLNSFEVFDS